MSISQPIAIADRVRKEKMSRPWPF